MVSGGFFDECIRKYGDSSVWKCFNDVFDYFTVSALIENEIFVVHGGLSPSIKSLNEIHNLDRVAEIGSISLSSLEQFILTNTITLYPICCGQILMIGRAGEHLLVVQDSPLVKT